MLTQTSELAIRALILIALEEPDAPMSPPQLAERLGCSPSYLAKILNLLVKAGILTSLRGARGGVLLAADPAAFTLRQIVEAAQGLILGHYCQTVDIAAQPVCAFHQAMAEVHASTLSILERWTLSDLAARPVVNGDRAGGPPCKMAFAGWEQLCPLPVRAGL